jgi:hypothetical protein
MKRRISDAVLGLTIGLAIMWIVSIKSGRPTVSSLSPDDSIRAWLVEISPTWAIDRNFAVRLEFLREDQTRTVFFSPDEGRPVGSERFIWSKDGTTLLLVGRHFYKTAEGPILGTGEQAYFLYHLPSRRGWCASTEQTKWPHLTHNQLRGIDFTEVIQIRNR